METDTVKFNYTNGCSCTAYDEATDSYVESMECFGDCWDATKEDFANITEHLFEQNLGKCWKVSNIRLWDGDITAYFYADNIDDLIKGMTVDSAWIMRGEVFDDRIEYSLSHHDAPTGSATVLTIVDQNEIDRLGL